MFSTCQGSTALEHDLELLVCFQKNLILELLPQYKHLQHHRMVASAVGKLRLIS